MSKHVPQQIDAVIWWHFSGQGLDACCIQQFMCKLLGVEKNNDDARRNYLYSNLHDAPKVLLTEVRQHTLHTYVRNAFTKSRPMTIGRIKDILSQRRQRN